MTYLQVIALVEKAQEGDRTAAELAQPFVHSKIEHAPASCPGGIFHGSARFIGASRWMRREIVEQHRQGEHTPKDRVLLLNTVLEEVAVADPLAAAILELDAFGGCSSEEIAAFLGIASDRVGEVLRSLKSRVETRLANGALAALAACN